MAVRETLSVITRDGSVLVRLRGVGVTFEGKDCAEALGHAGQFLDQSYAYADDFKRRYQAEMKTEQ
jgi:hypothetical protein